MKFKHLDLFSGIGGFSLGLEATGGFETVAFCDIEEYPRKVLQKHWPHVKQYKDIKELTYEKLKADGLVPIDIITGGYPCQPFSVAGRKKGEKDPRHLWPEYLRLIKECRPTWIIGENVSGHLKLGLDTVLENLESEGYSVRTFSISASSIGANHQRERIWIVAYSERNYNFNKEQRINGEEKEIQREHWEDNSTTRQSRGTSTVRQSDNTDVVNSNSIRSLQHTETTKETSRRGTEASFVSTSDVENSRRTLRPRTELQEKNEDEIERKDANQHQRSSSTSKSNVANTERKGLEGLNQQSTTISGKDERIYTRNESSRDQATETKDVANTQGERTRENDEGLRSGTSRVSGRKETNVANTESIRTGESREFNQEERSEGSGSTQLDGSSSNVSNTQIKRLERFRESSSEFKQEGATSKSSDEQQGRMDQGWWEFEPNVGRVAHGVPNRVDRLKSLGNSLVPNIPYFIGLSILETHDD